MCVCVYIYIYIYIYILITDTSVCMFVDDKSWNYQDYLCKFCNEKFIDIQNLQSGKNNQIMKKKKQPKNKNKKTPQEILRCEKYFEGTDSQYNVLEVGSSTG